VTASAPGPKDRPEPTAALSRFLEDWLAQAPPDLAQALSRAAVPHAFDASLLAALLGADEAVGQRIESLRRAGLVAELNRAAPLLRRELGRRMHIRTVPKLEFRYDEVVEHGARLSALIDAAVAADASRHRDDEGPPMNDAHPENAA